MSPKSQFGTVVKTVTRKLEKSIQQRGLVGTAQRCLTRPLRHGICFLKRFRPSQMARRRSEREFDRQFKVDTRQDKGFGWMAGIAGENWQHGTGYEPAPIKTFTDVFRKLPVPYEGAVFIDFGSGKGRTLLLAAQFPFQEIIGIEFSSQLNSVAEQNIRSYKNEERKCENIRSLCQDAAVAPIPLAPLVLFFNHPFDEPVFRPLVERIETSLRENPRPCTVVYFDPKCANLFDASPLFERIDIGDEINSKDINGFVIWQKV